MSERTMEARVAALEARVAELEQHAEEGGTASAETAYTQRFFALEALRERALEGGEVVYAGIAQTGAGPVEWQYGASVAEMGGQDWSLMAGSLDALGNPVRLSILSAVWSGVDTVAQLKERAEFGTTGQIYHHVNLLASAGWLNTRKRGHYLIPSERVIPLLVILTAARGS
ncbi:ArsR family transcriptional regulator [Nocardiopsis nanhaiensis]